MKSTSETVDEVISGAEYLEYSFIVILVFYFTNQKHSLFSVSMLLSCGAHFPSLTALKPQALL